MHGFDVATGTKRWSTTAGFSKPSRYGTTSPAIVGDTVVLIGCDSAYNADPRLVGLDLATGAVRWTIDGDVVRAAAKGTVDRSESWGRDSTPFVDAGTLYVQTSFGIVALR